MSLVTLKKRKEFLSVSAKKQFYKSSNLIIQYNKSLECFESQSLDSIDCLRFGFTATKRIGGAVTRNLAKRRLRMIARSIKSLTTFNGLSGDFVFIATNNTPTCLFKDLLSETIKGLLFLQKKYQKD